MCDGGAEFCREPPDRADNTKLVTREPIRVQDPPN
jgi:hypothetical protein